MILFSPYSYVKEYDRKQIMVTVNIAASPETVFDYLGNSDNAQYWSSFVDHIIPLNPEEKRDGEVHSLRRCFKNEDETGERWDEEILEVKKNTYRKLSCFNLQNFSMSAENIRTEQRYEDKNGQTKLSFTLFYEDDKASMIDELKMYYAAYIVRPIFKQNLQNIKQIIESQ